MTENFAFNNAVNLSVSFGKIELANPLIMCSGTFSSGIEYSKFYDIGIIGAVTTKSFSLESKKGNPPPRIWETPCGMLNSIGLQNEGIDFFINKQLPEAKSLGIKIILSIFGDDIGEFEKIVIKVGKIEQLLIAVELNLSCPNIKEGGLSLGSIPEKVEEITSLVCKNLRIPVIVKLSPQPDNIIESAKSAKSGGAEAISIINTIIGTAVDIETFKPRLGNFIGGLSGPAIKPISLAKIYLLYKENVLPIIGMGGIYSYKDVIEFLSVGAAAVGIGTANFIYHDTGKRIIEGLKNYLKEKKINDINEIIGRAAKIN